MGKQVEIHSPAPSFELLDFNGAPVKLSDYRGEKHVILVFNRGFV
ncbi:MAG: redoxin domain-containing protein [Anaerolineales bacterium]|nr:redoxin domain-containing protein [Chloroflexota bacterium]MBL6981453.1 redoxin domain-containing protein [Anaerolineales bacterium]